MIEYQDICCYMRYLSQYRKWTSCVILPLTALTLFLKFLFNIVLLFKSVKSVCVAAMGEIRSWTACQAERNLFTKEIFLFYVAMMLQSIAIFVPFYILWCKMLAITPSLILSSRYYLVVGKTRYLRTLSCDLGNTGQHISPTTNR